MKKQDWGVLAGAFLMLVAPLALDLIFQPSVAAHIIARAQPCAMHNNQFPNDGCAGGIAFTPPQNPNFFSKYKFRPPWPVPGVDYAVGASGQFKDPAVAGTLPACATYTAGAPNLVDVTTSPCTIDHFDFSGHNGICLKIDSSVAGGTVTITNNRLIVANRFLPTLSGQSCGAQLGMVNIVGTPTNFIFTYNTADLAYTQNTNYAIIQQTTSGGSMTVQYNAFYHCPAACISMGGTLGIYTIQYNYVEGVDSFGSGFHGDFWINNSSVANTTFGVHDDFNFVNIEQSSGNLLSTADCYMTTNVTTAYLSGDCQNNVVVTHAGHFVGGYGTRIDPFGNAVTVATTSPVFTWSGNNLANGQRVAIDAVTLPSPGFSSGTPYFVINRTATTFDLATTVGGAAIIPTAIGTTVRITRAGPITLSNNWYDATDSGNSNNPAGGGGTAQMDIIGTDGNMTNLNCQHNVDLTTGLPAIPQYTGTTTLTAACTP